MYIYDCVYMTIYHYISLYIIMYAYIHEYCILCTYVYIYDLTAVLRACAMSSLTTQNMSMT